MRAATEGSLPPVMPQGNLVEVLSGEVRQGSPGELMVKSTPSRHRRPPCKTNKEESDEAADAAALTYLLTYRGAAEGALAHCFSPRWAVDFFWWTNGRFCNSLYTSDYSRRYQDFQVHQCICTFC